MHSHSVLRFATVDIRTVAIAQHEAAHVVVGVSLGLRLKRAVVGARKESGVWFDGYAWFTPAGSYEAHAITCAAGVAWDASVRAPRARSGPDREACRTLVSSRHGYLASVRAAAALLAGLAPEHARVTRALLERDITGEDIVSLCRGELID